ncbi:helix-turn-helix domain-containing protein [Paraburkholderia kururiensis]|uniref:helix-turn-helix domain-containing protein n=1 Tax=Paraburkholderia kururiensis TaxID=984307 RepID=UPI000346575A|nr:helix-turn-helix domain-containing protein [Paraburkholderia kururiensis]
MSLYHENYAWEFELPALKKMVLVYLARAAHLSTRECNPTVQAISFMCGMSDSAVRTYLKELERDGHIETMKVPGRRVVYRVNLGKQGEQ